MDTTSTSILEVAEGLVRRSIPRDFIESVDVKEGEDWSGDPSLFVDVFLTPDTETLSADVSTEVRRSLTQGLLAEGERRFAYLRFRDRRGEEEQDFPGGPA